MQIPLEITYRNIEKTEEIDNLIREKTDKLEQVCDYITSCRVAVEKTQENPRSVNPYRVRLDMRVPPGHEIVVAKEPPVEDTPEPLTSIVRQAFDIARRQLRELVEKQRDETKVHPEQEVAAIISRIEKDEGYGFLRTIDGREIYFHKNSILNEEFQNLQEGYGVRFFEENGEKGPQASTVQVIERPT